MSIATLMLNIGTEVAHRTDIQPELGIKEDVLGEVRGTLKAEWKGGITRNVCVCLYLCVSLCASMYVCTHAHAWGSVPDAEKSLALNRERC